MTLEVDIPPHMKKHLIVAGHDGIFLISEITKQHKMTNTALKIKFSSLENKSCFNKAHDLILELRLHALYQLY